MGNVISVTDPLTNQTKYEYDKLNRLIQEIDAENRPTSYEYDPVGNLLSLTDPEQNTTSYSYDPPLYSNGTILVGKVRN
ncbi:MAG: RHS repeat domain-containing protein [Cyanobacteria bacterium P01_A01_bin.40]